MTDEFNEDTGITVKAFPKDSDGNAYTPTSARYRVDDRASGNTLVAWTTLTPATEIDITIPGSVNAMVGHAKHELKIVTVNTDNGLDSEVNEEYHYNVKNLRYV